jgi:hypothetical protein
MTDAVSLTCEQHEDRFECADCLMHYAESTGEYGIIIHDGGSSFVTIQYCPWCGQQLSDAEPRRRIEV